jgi:hypothetical protein
MSDDAKTPFTVVVIPVDDSLAIKAGPPAGAGNEREHPDRVTSRSAPR